jgi:hypothetical protein
LQAAGAAGVQLEPCTQAATQAPEVQTLVPPQLVPSVTLALVSVQTGAPVVQLIAPVWQALAGVQADPVLHNGPTKPWLKWVTLVVTVVPLIVAGSASYCVVLPGLVQ